MPKKLSMTGLKVELENWHRERFEGIDSNFMPYFSKGGWEGWLQVEWAMYLNSQDYDVLREEPIYNNNQRADLVINKNIPRGDNQVFNNIAIEIKCQSIYNSQDQFLESVKSDINKLEELRYYWSKLMVVVAIDDNILNLLRRENFLIRMHTNLAFGYRSV